MPPILFDIAPLSFDCQEKEYKRKLSDVFFFFSFESLCLSKESCDNNYKRFWTRNDVLQKVVGDLTLFYFILPFRQ